MEYSKPIWLDGLPNTREEAIHRISIRWVLLQLQIELLVCYLEVQFLSSTGKIKTGLKTDFRNDTVTLARFVSPCPGSGEFNRPSGFRKPRFLGGYLLHYFGCSREFHASSRLYQWDYFRRKRDFKRGP